MPTKTYFVKLRSMAIRQVRAAKVEVYSEHLVFTNAHGGLAALFAGTVILQRWTCVEHEPRSFETGAFCAQSGAYCFMPNKTFLVRLRSNATQQVRAATVEVHGQQLAFLTAKGKLAALFHLDQVESWNEIEPPTRSTSSHFCPPLTRHSIFAS